MYSGWCVDMLEWRDYVMLALGIFAICGAIYRCLVFRRIENHIITVLFFVIGICIFIMVFRKYKGRYRV